MIPLEESAALLLCAGLSRRYGPPNKLLAPLRGKPLVLHAAALLAALPLTARFAIVPPDEEELGVILANAGFICLRNPRPDEGKDQSIRIGLRAVLAVAPLAILLCLGDMPEIKAAHVRALAAAADGSRPAISAADGFRSPPVLIPTALAAVIARRPELGVREALTGAVEVRTDVAMLRVFDMIDDFVAARADAAPWPA